AFPWFAELFGRLNSASRSGAAWWRARSRRRRRCPTRQTTSCRRCSGSASSGRCGRSGCCRPPRPSQSACWAPRTPGTRAWSRRRWARTPPPQCCLLHERDASAADRLARSSALRLTGRPPIVFQVADNSPTRSVALSAQSSALWRRTPGRCCTVAAGHPGRDAALRGSGSWRPAAEAASGGLLPSGDDLQGRL
uniref:Transcriptional regulator, AraC family n=1 Tax=Macrostomum lignano TaxID=282301 RepID=A0A1I8FN94_9PLAT